VEDSGVILLSQVSPIKCHGDIITSGSLSQEGKKQLAMPSSTARQLPAFIGSCLY